MENAVSFWGSEWDVEVVTYRGCPVNHTRMRFEVNGSEQRALRKIIIYSVC
jgi:hypothetical protein